MLFDHLRNNFLLLLADSLFSLLL